MNIKVYKRLDTSHDAVSGKQFPFLELSKRTSHQVKGREGVRKITANWQKNTEVYKGLWAVSRTVQLGI